MRWVVIKGYGSRYAINEDGDVFSSYCMRILKPAIASHGYPMVALWRPEAKKGQSRTIHSLVAETFIGPPPEGMEVRHKDGCRTNPKLSNLEYGTHSDNIHDAVRHGTWHGWDGARKIRTAATFKKAWNTRKGLGGNDALGRS